MKGKRLLSALLALVMTLLLLPTGIAFAETYSARIERTEAFFKSSVLGEPGEDFMPRRLLPSDSAVWLPPYTDPSPAPWFYADPVRR